MKKKSVREKKWSKREYGIDKHKLLWYWMFQSKWKRIVCIENFCVHFYCWCCLLSCVIADWVRNDGDFVIHNALF